MCFGTATDHNKNEALKKKKQLFVLGHCQAQTTVFFMYTMMTNTSRDSLSERKGRRAERKIKESMERRDWEILFSGAKREDFE